MPHSGGQQQSSQWYGECKANLGHQSKIENFCMNEGEMTKAMFDRFMSLINQIRALGATTWDDNSAASTTWFSSFSHETLKQHHSFGCNWGVLWHPNTKLVVIYVHIATLKLCCNIYFFLATMSLMHPFLGFVLQLVWRTATTILSCISILCVAVERFYGHHISVGCL